MSCHCLNLQAAADSIHLVAATECGQGGCNTCIVRLPGTQGTACSVVQNMSPSTTQGLSASASACSNPVGRAVNKVICLWMQASLASTTAMGTAKRQRIAPDANMASVLHSLMLEPSAVCIPRAVGVTIEHRSRLAQQLLICLLVWWSSFAPFPPDGLSQSGVSQSDAAYASSFLRGGL